MVVAELTSGRACGWYVLEVPDGNTDVRAILAAIEHADSHTGQPVFININTVIGYGTAIAGTCKAHQAAFGHDNVKSCKESWGYDPEATHVVPDDVRDYWSDIPKKGRRSRQQWESTLDAYAAEYPRMSQQFHALMDGELQYGWKEALLNEVPADKKVPIRQSSATGFDILWKMLPLFGGSADLS